MTPAVDPLSPNQAAKRDAIIAATVDLLVREGVRGCTARSIAAAAGVAKGAVHYYFAEVDEIVDLAMVEATRSWVALIRTDERLGEAGADAEDRFWAAILAVLAPFSRDDRTLMPLWLEYWSARTRSGRLEPLRRVHAVLVDQVQVLVRALGVDDPEGAAAAVSAYLFGVGMQQAVMPTDTDAVREHVGLLLGRTVAASP